MASALRLEVDSRRHKVDQALSIDRTRGAPPVVMSVALRRGGRETRGGGE